MKKHLIYDLQNSFFDDLSLMYHRDANHYIFGRMFTNSMHALQNYYCLIEMKKNLNLWYMFRRCLFQWCTPILQHQNAYGLGPQSILLFVLLAYRFMYGLYQDQWTFATCICSKPLNSICSKAPFLFDQLKFELQSYKKITPGDLKMRKKGQSSHI